MAPRTITIPMIEIMALEFDKHPVKNEPVAFVFDQQKQHEGNALEVYHDLRDSTWPLGHLLGSISFDSRFCKLALQAADAWAYEARKHISDHLVSKRPSRWQFDKFISAKRFNVCGYEDTTMPKMLARVKEEWADGGVGLA